MVVVVCVFFVSLFVLNIVLNVVFVFVFVFALLLALLAGLHVFVVHIVRPTFVWSLLDNRAYVLVVASDEVWQQPIRTALRCADHAQPLLV